MKCDILSAMYMTLWPCGCVTPCSLVSEALAACLQEWCRENEENVTESVYFTETLVTAPGFTNLPSIGPYSDLHFLKICSSFETRILKCL